MAVGRLFMHRNRVMDGRGDAVSGQVGLQRVALLRAHHVQMIHVLVARRNCWRRNTGAGQ